MSLLMEISEALQKGKAKVVAELVQKAIDENFPAGDILNQGLLSGMDIIGEKFKNNEVFVPEVLIAARAMKKGMEILQPELAAAGNQPIGKAVIGTVKGDLHDIGKNLVRMMLEGKGIEVIDLGVDVSAEQFFEAQQEHNAQIVCCSALLTTTMNEMKNVVDLYVKEGRRDSVKIMVGGAPVTDKFCASIAADFYTPDAASAADVAKEILVG